MTLQKSIFLRKNKGKFLNLYPTFHLQISSGIFFHKNIEINHKLANGFPEREYSLVVLLSVASGGLYLLILNVSMH